MSDKKQMDLLILGALALGGALATGTIPLPRKNFTEDDATLEDHYRIDFRDMSEAGVFWGSVKPNLLNMTNLNNAWKPRSAPRQEPTRQVSAIFQDQASQAAYLKEYAYPFWFLRHSEMPLATAEQSNPNVEIPSHGVSFRWDPHDSLAHYPRVYSDGGPLTSPGIFTGDRGTMSAGEPTEDEERMVPYEGAQKFVSLPVWFQSKTHSLFSFLFSLSYHFNPFGPGGVFQRLIVRDNENHTRLVRTDQSAVCQPPLGRFTTYRLNAAENTQFP